MIRDGNPILNPKPETRAERGSPPEDFDHFTMQRRPLRSKLCRESSGACIARFDHFCVWINRPIGVGNHVIFIVFTALQVQTLNPEPQTLNPKP
jgi:hypothetical protein